MKLLEPGTGHQRQNKAKAVRLVAKQLLDSESWDEKTGELKTRSGKTFSVSAYTDKTGAFVKTPDTPESERSIYASGHDVIMVYQQQNPWKVVVYLADPNEIRPSPGSSGVPWPEVEKAARTMWVCLGDEVRRFGEDPG